MELMYHDFAGGWDFLSLQVLNADTALIIFILVTLFCRSHFHLVSFVLEFLLKLTLFVSFPCYCFHLFTYSTPDTSCFC